MSQQTPADHPPTKQRPRTACAYQAPKLTPLGRWKTLTLVTSVCIIGCTNLFGPAHKPD